MENRDSIPGLKKKVFGYKFKGNRGSATTLARWLVPHNAYCWQRWI